MRQKKDLTKGELAEIKELYLGTWSSVREMAMLFGTSKNVMAYLLDYSGYRKKNRKYNENWKKRNPERAKEINKKATNNYYHKNIVESRKKRREYYHKNKEKKQAYRREHRRKKYWENPEKYREIYRKWWRKNKSKINENLGHKSKQTLQ